MCNFGGGSLVKILGKMELNIKILFNLVKKILTHFIFTSFFSFEDFVNKLNFKFFPIIYKDKKLLFLQKYIYISAFIYFCILKIFCNITSLRY